jgi:hypothetical protein
MEPGIARLQVEGPVQANDGLAPLILLGVRLGEIDVSLVHPRLFAHGLLEGADRLRTLSFFQRQRAAIEPQNVASLRIRLQRLGFVQIRPRGLELAQLHAQQSAQQVVPDEAVVVRDAHRQAGVGLAWLSLFLISQRAEKVRPEQIAAPP